jgi:hypothetical protein
MKKFVLFLIFFSSICGCTTTKYVNHIELFRFKYPEEAKQYKNFEEISVEFIQRSRDQNEEFMSMFLNNIEQRIDNPEELKSYIERMRELYVYHSTCGNDAEEWEAFKTKIKSGDTVYDFEDIEGRGGTIVLRNGKIVYKSIYAGSTEDCLGIIIDNL